MPLLVGNPDNYQRISIKNKKGTVNLGKLDLTDFKIAEDRFLLEVMRQ